MDDTTTPPSLTFAEGYARLMKEGERGMIAPVLPSRMKRGEYRFADSVFQPRTFEGDLDASHEHRKELYEGLLRDDEFPPLVVWWSGKHYYVIDGHHRAMAIEAVFRDWEGGKLKCKEPPRVLTEGIAVQRCEGTLTQAVSHAATLNSRNKLPMSKKDKLERAWKLVTLEDASLSKKIIATATNVSERSVATMRERLRQWKDEHPGQDAKDCTWEEAKSRQERGEIGEAWEEAQAKAWAKVLGRAFGKKPSTLPDVFIRALELYSERLVVRLKEVMEDERMADEAGF